MRGYVEFVQAGEIYAAPATCYDGPKDYSCQGDVSGPPPGEVGIADPGAHLGSFFFHRRPAERRAPRPFGATQRVSRQP